MARHAKRISQGNAAVEHLSAGILALCFPMEEVARIIRQCKREALRRRELPPEVMVFYVIALSLFPDVSYQGVLRWILSGLQWLGNEGITICVKSSLSDARKRLGVEPFRKLYEEMAKPFASQRLKGSYWKGFHLVAMDGSTLALQDTKENAARYGRPSNQHGPGLWPLARFVVLAEVGTHMIFRGVMGAYRDSEIILSEQILPALRPGMLCLADRLFPGFELWGKASAQGCALVWRAKAGLTLPPVRTLSDGSWLAHWYPNEHELRKSNKQPHLVRVVEYKLHGGNPTEPETIYRLLTTILDPKKASALELAALYPQRWEIEICVKESKSILRRGRVTLRSKLPELVEQEFWGMLLAHYAIRKTMALAALQSQADPDTLSYQGSIEIIKVHIAGSSLPSPPQ